MSDKIKKDRGFTLIEILIVIVLIAILASITFPKLTGQQERAATAEAITIMGAVHRALLQYEDENGEFPTLADLSEIRTTLGIGTSKIRYDWTFSTNDEGNVTATRDESNLVLTSDGEWAGDGDYTPKTGKYWPYLQ